MNKKLPLILFISTIVSIILHNLIYALFGFEEPVFFILSLILALAFVISIIYLIIHKIKKK